MMDTIYRMLGLGALWDFVDGHKTAIAAAAGLLLGLGHLAVGAASIGLEVTHVQGLAQLVDLARNLSADPNWPLCLQGWAEAAAALAVLGIGHKLDKQTAAADARSAPAAQLIQQLGQLVPPPAAAAAAGQQPGNPPAPANPSPSQPQPPEDPHV